MIANIYDYSYHGLAIVCNFTGVISFNQSSPINVLTLHLRKWKVVVVNVPQILHLTDGVGTYPNT